jgi:hypothetical protein
MTIVFEISAVLCFVLAFFHTGPEGWILVLNGWVCLGFSSVLRKMEKK